MALGCLAKKKPRTAFSRRRKFSNFVAEFRAANSNLSRCSFPLFALSHSSRCLSPTPFSCLSLSSSPLFLSLPSLVRINGSTVGKKTAEPINLPHLRWSSKSDAPILSPCGPKQQCHRHRRWPAKGHRSCVRGRSRNHHKWPRSAFPPASRSMTLNAARIEICCMGKAKGLSLWRLSRTSQRGWQGPEIKLE